MYNFLCNFALVLFRVQHIWLVLMYSTLFNVHLTFAGDFYGVLMKYLSKTKSTCAIESSLSWARKIAKKIVLRV